MSSQRAPTSWVAAAAPEGSWPAADNDPLGPVERRMLQIGKKDHRETTESARRALRIAEQTAEVASNTLVEVERQGLQLHRTEEGIESMEKDVLEASRIVRFMQRWCCFQVLCCCDCFDPDTELNRTRNARLRNRKEQRSALDEVLKRQAAAQQESVSRAIATKGDAAFNGNDEAARAELLAVRVRRKTATDGSEAPPILGYGLPDGDREEIQAETRRQDAYLDRIGTTVESLRIMSLDLHEELAAQDPQIEVLRDRVHNAHDNIGTLSKKARKI